MQNIIRVVDINKSYTMKKNALPLPSDGSSKVKEISDGVYINLNRITTDEKEFDKAIEESFKELEKEEENTKLREESGSAKSADSD